MVRTPDECSPVYAVRFIRLLSGGVEVSQFVPGFGCPRVFPLKHTVFVEDVFASLNAVIRLNRGLRVRILFIGCEGFVLFDGEYHVGFVYVLGLRSFVPVVRTQPFPDVFRDRLEGLRLLDGLE